MHLSRRQPHQWIDPVDGTGHLGNQLSQAVPPCDVGQFVNENGVQFIGVPGAGFGGQKELGAQDAPGHGHGTSRRYQESDAPADAEFRRSTANRLGKRSRNHDLASTPEHRQEDAAEKQAEKQKH